VRILALGAPPDGSDAAVMRNVAERMGIARAHGPIEPRLDDRLIVDALFGTGLDRELSPEAIALVDAINDSGTPVLSVDLPSGLDADTGMPRLRAVRATVTATMVVPKVGMLAPGAAAFTGRIETVPIGGPPPS
jgi:NAD(P)H-hydrate epimerase